MKKDMVLNLNDEVNNLCACPAKSRVMSSRIDHKNHENWCWYKEHREKKKAKKK